MNKDLIASLEQLTQQVRDQDKTHAQIIKDIRLEVLREMEKEIAKVVQQATRDAIQNLIERFDLMPKPQPKPSRGLMTTKEMSEALERRVLASMTDNQHAAAHRRRKATKATHRINSHINLPKFKELRDNGFCEGMKFNVIETLHTIGGWSSVCIHPRTGRKARIKSFLLTEIKPDDF